MGDALSKSGKDLLKTNDVEEIGDGYHYRRKINDKTFTKKIYAYKDEEFFNMIVNKIQEEMDYENKMDNIDGTVTESPQSAIFIIGRISESVNEYGYDCITHKTYKDLCQSIDLLQQMHNHINDRRIDNYIMLGKDIIDSYPILEQNKISDKNMNTTNNRQQSACFTGHRQMGDINPTDLRQRVRDIISEWYDEGITTYYCGMALGFDMLCAEVLLGMRDDYPGLMLVAAVPFNGQEDRWQEQSKRRYRNILNQADEVVYVSQRYERGCEGKRNRYMIDHSSRVIAFYDGVNPGGTGKTVAMAKRNNMMVVNIYPQVD